MSKPEHTPSGSGGGEHDNRTQEPDLGKPKSAEPTAPVPAEPDSAQPDAAGAGAKPSAAAKPEPAAAAAAKPAAAKPDADAGAPGRTKADLAKPVSAKTDLAKPAAGKPEPVKADPATPGAVKPAAAKPEPGKADPAKPGVGKPEPGKADPAKPGAGKPESGTADPAKPGVGKPAVGKAEPVKADTVKPGVGKPAAGKAEPVKDARPKGVTGDTAEDEGRLLARRYRLERVLGKGGMGTVWRAVDETLGRTVAVKELRFSSGVDEDEKRRLITRTLREAKAIARIRSGGAVTVFDVVDEDGRPWIVMELVEGSSLAEFIREKGTLTPRRAAEVGLAVLDVLKAAHGEGILHRDVKPSNVLISDSGRVVLTDFGIAQVEGDPSVTSTGMLVGAPSYISPERARGQKPGPPADMWSLGGLLYAAVEGVPPYDKGSALATLTAVMTEPVDPPKNAGPLTEVIYGLLVKDPDRRLDDAGARAMLTAVVNAPDAPAEAPADETRVISLSAAKAAAEKATADKAAEKAAEKAAAKAAAKREREQRDRAREALKAARKAAAAAAAAAAATTASAAEAPAAGAKSGSAGPASAAAAPTSSLRVPKAVAPLTDVMQRRTIALAIAALVVVLAVVGSLVVWAFGDDEDKGGKDAAKVGNPGTQVSGTPSPGSGTGGDGKGGSTPAPGQSSGQGSGDQGSGSGSGSGTAGSSGTPGTIPGGPGGAGSGMPAGFVAVINAEFHFAMAMPEGFVQTGTAGEKSGAIYSRNGGFPRIQVDFNKSPKDDAKLAWVKAAPFVAGSSREYRQIRIDLVDYRGYPTVADWEFERKQNGMMVRVLNRGFKVDAKHGYAIMISCAADQWDGAECTQLRKAAFDTFRPVD
ncbi:protein kinase [Streptomyces sp. NPDC051211]|uniref:protein kinase domain-containing protein n=1 Tax=Streptomyces sp. NPDC051211 TaxID=3154643 RepID=UPI00344B6AAD